jgi:threonine dehydrogenase-like Zn-dependent dehydrogenase
MPEFEIALRGGQVIDGTGNPWYRADLGIRDGRVVRIGAIDPSRIVTQERPINSVLEAYEHFDRREPGWLKVEILPAH